MQTRTLGRSGLAVSSIGLGCVTFDREITPADSFRIMDHAVDRGITLFDTAEAYASGKSEATVGAWLRQSGKRDRIVLATKAVPPLGAASSTPQKPAWPASKQTSSTSTSYTPGMPTRPSRRRWHALDTLVRQGKVRHIGCSNFFAWQLCKALYIAERHGWPRMESVQPNYNLAVRDIESELLPFCAEEEIGVITYSPLGAGFLTGKYHTAGVAPAGTRFDIKPAHWDVYQGPTAMRRMEGLRATSAETGRSMVDLALSWVTGRPGLTSVLIGARTPQHIDQALEAEEKGLEPDLRQALNEL